MEIQFYKKNTETLSANIYEMFEGRVKRLFLCEISEANIYHSGWLWSTCVSSMDRQQKKAFIKSLAERRISKIQDNNVYLY